MLTKRQIKGSEVYAVAKASLNLEPKTVTVEAIGKKWITFSIRGKSKKADLDGYSEYYELWDSREAYEASLVPASKSQDERIQDLEKTVTHLIKVIAELIESVDGMSLEPHVYTNEPMLVFEDAHEINTVRALLSEIQ